MKIVFLLFLSLFSARSLFGYGQVGHQIVGAIADEKLAGTPTGKKITEMLDGFTLQKAAVIADEIKGWDKPGADSPNIFHYTSRPRIDEQLRAFWKANQPTDDPHSAMPSHHWFHYTDVPILNPEKYGDGKTGRSQWDIVHMMRYCIAVLRGEEPEENARKITKPIAIILLAHYVGDIHQPLHVGAEYFDASGNPVDPDKGAAGLEDRGGGTISLQIGGDRKKLHGFWDNDAVAALLPDVSDDKTKQDRRAGNDAATTSLVHQLATQEPKNWREPASMSPNEYPEAWANDILPVAREAHERLRFQNMRVTQQEGQSMASGVATEKPAADKHSYRDWASGVVREELHKAGWRLADLLEKILQAPAGKAAAAPAPSLAANPAPNSSLLPSATPAPAAPSPSKFTTITRPITIKVSYGAIQIPVGTKLPYSARNADTVRLRYQTSEYDVPITSTDLQ